MRTTKQEKQTKMLEEQNLYNNETTNIQACHYVETTGKFDYFKYGFWGRFLGTITKGLIKILDPIIVKMIYHLKVEGKENLKLVKDTGVIGIANHSQYTDLFISKRVFYHKKLYITAAIFNNKKGLGGNILRCIGMLPMSRTQSTVARRKFDDAVEKVLKDKNAVMFYPEKAMWKNYRKPRPFFKGAFYYAVKNNVPILPMIVLYRPTSKWNKFWGRKNKLTVKILPPIYQKQNLSEKENVEYLKQKAQYLFNEEYENFYGVKNNVIDVADPDKITIFEASK